MLRRVLHINLSVVDVEAARAFYADVLGLEEVPRAKGALRDGAWFALGSFEVHLSREVGGQEALSKRHVAFEVRDLDEAAERLKKAGAPVDPGSPLEGVRRLFTRDPSGNRIELQQRVGHGGRCG